MGLYYLIIQNKELIKILYGFIISLICAIIVLKTHRLFSLSLHHGIRYFRNAFFFYGIAFIIRYLLGTSFLSNYIVLNYYLIKFLFEFFIIMGGFFLLYSLIWKKIETSEKYYYSSSLFNKKILLFYIMTFVIALLDYFWNSYYFVFCSQIILFAIVSIISYNNYLEKPNAKFLKFYFIAMLFGFVAWVLNSLAGLLFNWNYTAIIIIYSLNMMIFLLFLYGVIKITKPT